MNGRSLTAHSAGPRDGGGDAHRDGPRPREDFLSGASAARSAASEANCGGYSTASSTPRGRPRGGGCARAATAAPRRRGARRRGGVRDDVENRWDLAAAELERSHHDVSIHARSPAGGKFQTLNRMLAEDAPDRADWLLVVDDDVALPSGFLDLFLYAAESTGLRIAQPAHRLYSHAAWDVTRRRALSLVRETTFVEIGPVTAFHRDTFSTLLPFPQLRMGWGLDAHWSAIAREHGWPIGVVDLTPIGHALRPAGDSYPREEAIAEGRAFLEGRPYVRREEVRTVAVRRGRDL